MRAVELIAEIDRRGFLGAVGAGAMAAAGVPALSTPLFCRACQSIKRPLTAHDPIQRQVSSRLFDGGRRGTQTVTKGVRTIESMKPG
jgi:hypothetical protein